jgi:hypothetical protein
MLRHPTVLLLGVQSDLPVLFTGLLLVLRNFLLTRLFLDPDPLHIFTSLLQHILLVWIREKCKLALV